MRVFTAVAGGALFIVAVTAALAGLSSLVWAAVGLDDATGLHLNFIQFCGLFAVLRLMGLGATYNPAA